MNKTTIIISVVALILSVSALIVASTKTVETLGGYTAGYWDSDGGYKVDGTTVIDGSGGITGTTATLSSTLAVTGKTTLTGDVAISTTTLVADLIVYDATATSTVYITGGGVYGGQIVIQNIGGAGCVAIRFLATGSMSTTSIACGVTTGYVEY